MSSEYLQKLSSEWLDSSSFVRSGTIGTGDTGITISGKFYGTPVAGKLYFPFKEPETYELRNSEEFRAFEEETYRAFEIWKNLRHPNLVLFLGVVSDPDTYKPYILTELAVSNLKKELEANASGLSISVVLNYSLEILFALTYLHAREVIHQNIKPSNILIFRGDVVKLGDIGISSIMRRLKFDHSHQYFYSAPEAPGKVTSKSDMYAFGLVLLEMLTGASLTSSNLDSLFKAANHRQPALAELAAECVREDPASRITAAQALERLEAIIHQAETNALADDSNENTDNKLQIVRDFCKNIHARDTESCLKQIKHLRKIDNSGFWYWVAVLILYNYHPTAVSRIEKIDLERTKSWIEQFEMKLIRCSNTRDAASLKLMAAQTEEPILVSFLGYCYDNGLGVKHSPNKAATYYQMAADQNDPTAQTLLAKLFEQGTARGQDYRKAIQYYKLAADQGYPQAQTALGSCYGKGRGVAVNLETSFSYYKLAADQKYHAALTRLGVCYQHGKGTTKDPELAVQCFQAASEQGEPEAQALLGFCYETGEGVPKDITKAVQYYQSAAAQNDPVAQTNLGICYEKGIGVNKNPKKAFEFYQLAAAQGYPTALTYLGLCYENGDGVAASPEMAVKYYKAAADKGFARAQTNLGSCYYTGKGVEKNLKLAVQYFQMAADQGNRNAQLNLGVCYKLGSGVTKNLERAAHYYTLAAQQGDPVAQTYLGVTYQAGQGVPRNLEKAAQYFKMAADQGYAPAQTYLGNCYKAGHGVPRDLEKALEYLEAAAKQGYTGSI